jgi:hypothetical protein
MTRFLVKLVKYWYLYLIPILLIPTAATLYGLKKETVYESTALINVVKLSFLTDYQANTDNPYATQAQNVVDNMTPYLESPSFMAKVAARTSLRTVYDLTTPGGRDAAVGRIAGNVSVSAPGKMFISVTADDRLSPVVAQELANGVIDEFNSTYAQTEKDYLTKASEYYKQQADSFSKTVGNDIAAISSYTKTHPNAGPADPTLAGLNAQLGVDQKKLSDTNDNLNGVNQSIAAASNGTPYDLSLQDPPTLPKSSTVKASKVVVYPIGALVAVLALLAIIAGIQTKLDRRVYDRQDIEGILDKLEWDPTAVEVMPIISANGGSGSIRWDDRENSPVPALMTPVLASLPRPARKQLRSGTTQAPRRESQPESARGSSYVEDEP